jgi:exodeoxyribonuclease VII large subunit
MQAYSLYELNEYIRRVIVLNFDEPIWIQAEISQIKEVRGQAYLDLVEHNQSTGTIKAKSSAVIWYKSLLFVKKKLGELSAVVLKEGSQVMLKVTVDFSEKYGLKLIVEDIDATYSIGQMELAKQKILARLKKEGIIDQNKQSILPSVISNIAVISSPKAAGYADFKKQIAENSYGYGFKIHLFKAAMQGQNVEREVVNGIRKANNKSNYDCIIIIRGGGSRSDLSFFDNYNIAHSIAMSKLPVLTGIGHDIDETVADLVAFRSLKTPTAVADFIIEKNLHFESQMIQNIRYLSQLTNILLNKEKIRLQHLYTNLRTSPNHLTGRQKIELTSLNLKLESAISQWIQKQKTKLEKMNSFLELSDPKNILKKGYVMVKKEGKVVVDGHLLKPGDKVELNYYNKKHKATINEQ